MDNEAVRFPAAIKQGVQFDDAERKNFSVSWEKSVEETARLINYVSSCPPHKISETISLNNCRRMITQLTKPLADIINDLKSSIALILRYNQPFWHAGV